jgi:hypothetical protein
LAEIKIETFRGKRDFSRQESVRKKEVIISAFIKHFPILLEKILNGRKRQLSCGQYARSPLVGVMERRQFSGWSEGLTALFPLRVLCLTASSAYYAVVRKLRSGGKTQCRKSRSQ